jgi:hypothetical protein
MPQLLAAGEGVVPARYHSFYLADHAVFGPESPLVDSNGLIAAQPGIAVVFTGIHTGGVALTAQAYDARPEPDVANWDEVVELSMHAPTGRVIVTGVDVDAPQHLPMLTPAGPGHYRVRIHVRGRDTAIDLVTEQPVEDYLVQTWPAAPLPATVLKQSDQYGASRRQRTHLST